ncbi:MAG: hypothetical protein N2651_06125, partial [Fimbriimonadales bacterium]|nr:hypothetical protein [Fimbriimonadales bacterium]
AKPHAQRYNNLHAPLLQCVSHRFTSITQIHRTNARYTRIIRRFFDSCHCKGSLSPTPRELHAKRVELYIERVELYAKRVELSRNKRKSLGEREPILCREELNMAVDFIKRRDREFEAQLGQFLANLEPIKTALGLPANCRQT